MTPTELANLRRRLVWRGTGSIDRPAPYELLANQRVYVAPNFEIRRPAGVIDQAGMRHYVPFLGGRWADTLTDEVHLAFVSSQGGPEAEQAQAMRIRDLELRVVTDAQMAEFLRSFGEPMLVAHFHCPNPSFWVSLFFEGRDPDERRQLFWVPSRKERWRSIDLSRFELIRSAFSESCFREVALPKLFDAMCSDLEVLASKLEESDRCFFSGSTLVDVEAASAATRITHCKFEDCRIVGFKSKRADLADCSFHGSRLFRCDFSGSRLRNVDFGEAQIVDCNFAGADLSGATLIEADLRRCDFSGASLERANLKNADVRNANFSGADLRRANLTGVDFRNARLEGVKWPQAGRELERVLANVQGNPGRAVSRFDNSLQEAEHVLLEFPLVCPARQEMRVRLETATRDQMRNDPDASWLTLSYRAEWLEPRKLAFKQTHLSGVQEFFQELWHGLSYVPGSVKVLDADPEPSRGKVLSAAEPALLRMFPRWNQPLPEEEPPTEPSLTWEDFEELPRSLKKWAEGYGYEIEQASEEVADADASDEAEESEEDGDDEQSPAEDATEGDPLDEDWEDEAPDEDDDEDDPDDEDPVDADEGDSADLEPAEQLARICDSVGTADIWFDLKIPCDRLSVNLRRIEDPPEEADGFHYSIDAQWEGLPYVNFSFYCPTPAEGFYHLSRSERFDGARLIEGTVETRISGDETTEREYHRICFEAIAKAFPPDPGAIPFAMDFAPVVRQLAEKTVKVDWVFANFSIRAVQGEVIEVQLHPPSKWKTDEARVNYTSNLSQERRERSWACGTLEEALTYLRFRWPVSALIPGSLELAVGDDRFPASRLQGLFLKSLQSVFHDDVEEINWVEEPSDEPAEGDASEAEASEDDAPAEEDLAEAETSEEEESGDDQGHPSLDLAGQEWLPAALEGKEWGRVCFDLLTAGDRYLVMIQTSHRHQEDREKEPGIGAYELECVLLGAGELHVARFDTLSDVFDHLRERARPLGMVPGTIELELGHLAVRQSAVLAKAEEGVEAAFPPQPDADAGPVSLGAAGERLVAALEQSDDAALVFKIEAPTGYPSKFELIVSAGYRLQPDVVGGGCLLKYTVGECWSREKIFPTSAEALQSIRARFRKGKLVPGSLVVQVLEVDAPNSPLLKLAEEALSRILAE